MAQVFTKLGGIFPKGSGKGIAGGAGALITLGALGYGLNAALFNGKWDSRDRRNSGMNVHGAYIPINNREN